MPISSAGLCRGAISSNTLPERINVLILLLVLALAASSCVTNAEAAGNALTLTGSFSTATTNQAYNAVLTVSGGPSPYQFTIASGSLPPGVTLNSSTGSVTGSPTASGNYVFEIVVTNTPNSGRGTQTFAIQVNSPVSVSVSPANITLTSGTTQQFTATVTGTSNTAVTWTASSGTINSNGVYTAPTVQSGVTATVTATSQANSTVAANAAVAVSPSQSQPLQITTSSLPPAEQGDTYSGALAATGGTQPYSWSLSSGALPSGVTLNSGGDLAGTPSAQGTFSFSVTVTDAKQLTTSANLSMNVSSSSGYDGPAQLPLVTISTTMPDSQGSVITVNAGGDLQTAMDQAQCGQTIQLQQGATFTGQFTVPAKSCDANHWIIIRTSAPDSALPAEGQRLTPCYAGVASLVGRPAYPCPNPENVLAKVQTANRGDGPFKIAAGANYYRFIGLEITRQPGTEGPAKLISLIGTADHIFVDRSWLHGNVNDETQGGFGTSGGTYIAVFDSYLNDFHCISVTGTCTDAHAISGGCSDTQDGPYLIQDNFLEASGEEVMFGGGPATKTPTDITVQNNHFWKPWQWRPGNPNFVGGPDGHPFIVKNHMELKNAVRVLVQANLMENTWGGFTQHGYAVLFTPKNQFTRSGASVCPLCQVTDITFRYNQTSHSASGLAVGTGLSDGGTQALAGTRFSVHDIVMDDISTAYGGAGTAFEIVNSWPNNPLSNVTINHVTAFPDPEGHLMIMSDPVKDPQMSGFVFTNNLILTAAFPVWNASGDLNGVSCAVKDVPIVSITNCFTTFTFQDNGLIGSPVTYPPSAWPGTNFFLNTPAAVEFVNYNNGNGGNYELQSGSPYKNKGSDGKDLGADIVGLNEQLANVD